MTSSPSRILVADDEADLRELVCRVLAAAGYLVDQAPGGTEALDALARTCYDLLVLDLMMPEVDGWTVLERLREVPGAPPVVVLTVREDAEAFTRAVSRGALAYVSKPFRFGDLLATCRRVLLDVSRGRAAVAVERRREPRRFLMAAVTVYSRERRPMALGELTNVSPGGSQVELGVRLDAGSHVLVGFQGGGVSLTVEGRVQWNRSLEEGRVAHGIAFLFRTSEQERPVRDLLGITV